MKDLANFRKSATVLWASITALLFCVNTLNVSAQELVHPQIGTTALSKDGALKLELISKRQNYTGGEAETRDEAIYSPKSANVHPSNKKYYVNSLEGGTTVVFEMGTNKRLKTISHHINKNHSHLWSEPSSFYSFTHYPKSNIFMGKPVEATFSHNGRYLWVPYYRRTYDINAQDPSAVAIIDTETDEIIRLMETGPLPKMIATSHDGNHLVISHWGNNTIGIIDISSSNPQDWMHKDLLVVDYVLPLNYSTTEQVDRDNGSGYALRGTVFTPDDRYLLVGCMGGGGGIAGAHGERIVQSYAGNSQAQVKLHALIGELTGSGFSIRQQRALVIAFGFDSKSQVTGGGAAHDNHGQVEIRAPLETQRRNRGTCGFGLHGCRRFFGIDVDVHTPWQHVKKWERRVSCSQGLEYRDSDYLACRRLT